MSLWSLLSTSWVRSQRFVGQDSRTAKQQRSRQKFSTSRGQIRLGLETLEDRTLLSASLIDSDDVIIQSTTYGDFRTTYEEISIDTFAVANPLATTIIVQAPGGVTFNLISDPGMDQRAIDGFVDAALLWSQIFTDDVTINLDIGFSVLAPNVLGQASSSSISTSYSDFYMALDGDRTTLEDDAAVASLSTGSTFDMLLNHVSNSPETDLATPFVDDDGDANNSTIDINTATAKAIGLLAANDSAVDASITFSSEFSWDFDQRDGINSNQLDFVGVAAHEIGHALGFVSGVDALDYNPDDFMDDEFIYVAPLDLFRYSTESAAEGSGIIDWTADTRFKYFSLDNGQTSLALFSTGTFLGDGWQASHWKDDLGIGIMDPTAEPPGGLMTISDLDILAFDVIGWNINKPPALTSIATLPGGVEDTPLTITYDDLFAASDASDPEGDPISFFIDSVAFGGTLTKNGSLAIPGTTLSAGESLEWTPPANANGDALLAFTVRAQDLQLAVSTPSIAVRVDVAAVNDAPVADIGDDYVLGDRAMIQLDASGSSDVEQSAGSLVYLWDFDNDGQYDDAVGVRPDFSAAYLNGQSNAVVRVKVIDNEGAYDTDVVRVYGEDTAVLRIRGDYDGVVGQRRVISLKLYGPTVTDQQYTYTVDWGDGSKPRVVTGISGLSISKIYNKTGTYTITATAVSNETGLNTSYARNIRIGTVQQQGDDFAVTGTNARDEFRVVTLAGTDRVEIFRNRISLGVHTVPGTIYAIGMGGDDWFRGDRGTYDVYFDGGSGNNVSYTYYGDDTILGRDGNDRVYNYGGDNQVSVGNGNNFVKTNVGDDYVMTGYGDDRIIDFGGNNEIYAGDGDNAIDTRKGNDLIVTGSGQDEVNDLGGNNYIEVGNGSNVVSAGIGSDTILGGDQDDSFRDDGGLNYIFTFAGNDFIVAFGTSYVNSGLGSDFVFASNVLDDEDDLFDLLARAR
ncbi:Hemolysin, plasmid [Symmachiella dynata]|uniref:NF038122 family metalloprotease n=1 Tax=Symmachiella dynata TaxID=2527995 RepID=UPI001187774A|nr:NF038122 family metalloprotease [Symmachiella dynata]QDT46908.1 Hemolysin, plasmid [Symmachiella dynata]